MERSLSDDQQHHFIPIDIIQVENQQMVRFLVSILSPGGDQVHKNIVDINKHDLVLHQEGHQPVRRRIISLAEKVSIEIFNHHLEREVDGT